MSRFQWILSLAAIGVIAVSCASPSTPVTDDDEDDPVAEAPINPKKGFGIVINDSNDWARKVAALDVSWHYSWGSSLPASYPRGVEFVPMIWGAFGNFSSIDQAVTNVNTWANQGRVKYLLGFNEPDGAEQANLTVEKAIEAWPKLMNANVPLGSPAPIHTNAQWLRDFMAQADAKEYRVDFIAVHWYKGPNADAFIREIEAVYAEYGLPIWITEFGVADWGVPTVEQNRYTAAQVLAFMQNILPRLDDMEYVHRYAWFNSSTTHPALAPSALFNTDGSLTPLGEYYKSFR